MDIYQSPYPNVNNLLGSCQRRVCILCGVIRNQRLKIRHFMTYVRLKYREPFWNNLDSRM